MNTNDTLPETAEQISKKLEKLSGSKILCHGKSYKDILHNGERNTDTCLQKELELEWIKRLAKLDIKKVGIDVQEQVLITYNALIAKFKAAENKLGEIGIQSEEIAEACITMLIRILEEVSSGERKFTNGDVLSLTSMQGNQLKTQTIGYYEFACCNVSLDEVSIRGKTLREISDLCNDTDDVGNFLLPNSLGVSVSLMAKDEKGKPIFIGQLRNNATTVTQRDNTKVVSAASGGIDPGKDFTQMGSIELEEELGIKGLTKSINSEINSLMTGDNKKDNIKIARVLIHELGIGSADIEFGGIVFEEKRRNPELVLKASTDLSEKDISHLWLNAKDRNESTGIRSISLEEIGDNLSGEKETLGRHFMQSLLAWYITKKS